MGDTPQAPSNGTVSLRLAANLDDLRAIALRLIDNKGLRHCGSARARGSVTVCRRARGELFIAGRQQCKLNICPRCGPRRALGCRRRLRARLDAAARAGQTVIFVTLTIPHGHDGCARLYALVGGAWTRMQNSAFYRRLRRDHHIVQVIRCWDYSWSPQQGHNPHLHLLVILDHPTGDAVAVQADFAAAWIAATAAEGGEARMASLEHGCIARLVGDTPEDRGRIATYVTTYDKREKLDREGRSFSPLGLLRHVATTGDIDGTHARAWWQWARAFTGKALLRAKPALPEVDTPRSRADAEPIVPIPWHLLDTHERRQADALCADDDLGGLHALIGKARRRGGSAARKSGILSKSRGGRYTGANEVGVP